MDISMRKVSASKLVPQPVIRLRRASDGEIVSKERVLGNGEILPRKPESEGEAEGEEYSGYHWKFICNGAEVPEEQVKYFKVGEDGKESETRPFDATAEIKVIREVSASGMNTFLVEIASA